MPNTHAVVELFAGICGVSVGFHDSRHFRPALFIDNDEITRDVFSFNYPRAKSRFVCQDIRKITAKDIIKAVGPGK